MDKKIDLAILLCDHNLPELEPGQQTLPILWTQFFRDSNIHLHFYKAYEGEYPDNGSKHHFLITGSRYCVLDDSPWIKQLCQFVKDHAYQKLVGICFGHQLIAHSLGGTVVPGHWHIGVRNTIPFDKSNGEPNQLTRYNHQDHVASLPMDAIQTYTSDNCEIAGFKIANKILTYQFHPEFTERYHKLLHEAKKANFTEEEFIEAKQHLNDPTDHDLFKQKIISFLNQ